MIRRARREAAWVKERCSEGGRRWGGEMQMWRRRRGSMMRTGWNYMNVREGSEEEQCR